MIHTKNTSAQRQTKCVSENVCACVCVRVCVRARGSFHVWACLLQACCEGICTYEAFSNSQFTVTCSSVEAPRGEKKENKNSSCKRPAELCVKNSSSQQTNTLSQLTEEEGNKEKCLFSSWNGQKDVTGRK